METAIRFSQNSQSDTDQRFLHVDVTGKSFKLCSITEKQNRRVQYSVIASSTKVPAFRAFDWHPTNEDLVVVGQAGGEATLLNIANGQHDSVSFSVRSQRLCNAVSLNSQNVLAAGLDRVRTDFCLNIWDFNQRLPEPGSKGFSKSYSEPLHKLASGETITSLKFFQDDPQLLVAGVKGQFVRLYDLREGGTGNGLQFATRCVNNLAIDWKDENYFASCYPTNDPSICVWDRRMPSGNSVARFGSAGSSPSDSRQPESSLELRNAVDSPGSIWSLRFAKSRRGYLGVLSSTGHLKVYEIHQDATVNGAQDQEHDLPDGHPKMPHDVYLNRSQDIERHYSRVSVSKEEKARVVSFDFMTSNSKCRQPDIITLTVDGEIKTTSMTPLPEPALFASTAFLQTGQTHASPSISSSEHVADQLRALRDTSRGSGLDEMALAPGSIQSLQHDLGPDKRTMSIPDLLSLLSSARLRCEAGYAFNAALNKSIVSESSWLQSLWSYIAHCNDVAPTLSSENSSLAHLGISSIWNEKHFQSSGPSSVISSVVHRLHLPIILGLNTSRMIHRQLSLHLLDLSWTPTELDALTAELLTKRPPQHSKAAFLALISNDRRLASKILRSKGASQDNKMLAMAVAGSGQPQKSDVDAASWQDTLDSLSEGLTDPFALASLGFVSSDSWHDVLSIDSLPIRYRLCLALRHLDDTNLTNYLKSTLSSSIATGDLSAIALTGTGTPHTFSLFESYVSRYSDIQTAVLALSPSIPKHITDPKTIRKFDAWKSTYRRMLMSWNLKYERVRFDIAVHKFASTPSTRAAPSQVKLVCTYCASPLAHHPAPGASANSNEADGSTKTHDTAKHPLSVNAATAAAIGTVCPRCGRGLPKCGVCDLPLGKEDSSYLKWYGRDGERSNTAGRAERNVDMSASTGTVKGVSSTGTVKGDSKSGSGSAVAGKESPGVKAVIGAAKTETKDVSESAVMEDENKAEDTVRSEVERVKQLDEAMERFTVFCVKCSHGFHAAHARMWFQGSGENGRRGHSVCPVPKCECVCYG